MAEAMKCGQQEFEVHLPAELIAAELEPNRVELPQRTAAEHIRWALDHPVDSAPLKELVKAGDKVCIVISDVTRRWQSPETYIPVLVAELEAQRAAQSVTSSGGSANATGSFLWPVASYVYVSSRFGLRIHPITGEEKTHTGLDIASNQGTAVYASDGGTVTLAGWNGGYGNCIMIDHGNGYVTLYGHLSSIGVSEGQTVNRGDTIGAVGSTGNSTGPHLHFEVIQNGTRIDPEQFFSGLNISADAGV